MNKKKYYKNLFLCAALWNWAVGISLLTLSFIAPHLFPLFGVKIPPSLVFVQMLFILVTIFGIGFIIVHLDIEKNRGIVQMSVLEKFSFFIVFLIYFLLNHINFFVLLLNIIDLIFGILFVEFLMNANMK